MELLEGIGAFGAELLTPAIPLMCKCQWTTWSWKGKKRGTCLCISFLLLYFCIEKLAQIPKLPCTLPALCWACLEPHGDWWPLPAPWAWRRMSPQLPYLLDQCCLEFGIDPHPRVVLQIFAVCWLGHEKQSRSSEHIPSPASLQGL